MKNRNEMHEIIEGIIAENMAWNAEEGRWVNLRLWCITEEGKVEYGRDYAYPDLLDSSVVDWLPLDDDPHVIAYTFHNMIEEVQVFRRERLAELRRGFNA